VHFAYAGDGPALEDFRRQADTHRLRRFHFLGRRNDVPELVGSATVAVVPSLWAEAFGLTVAEAMAAGVPVVASSVGGIPELIDQGETGMLVPPGDASALAAALRELLDDPARRARMGPKARETAWVRFSHTRVADELAAVLLDLDD
jgi:glycosyltransferase involved in cell wall biosynthesis